MLVLAPSDSLLEVAIGAVAAVVAAALNINGDAAVATVLAAAEVGDDTGARFAA